MVKKRKKKRRRRRRRRWRREEENDDDYAEKLDKISIIITKHHRACSLRVQSVKNNNHKVK